MSLDDYLPFDPDTDESGTNAYINEIFNDMGFTVWRDVFHDIVALPDADNERGVRYSTPEEALIDLYERGLLGFSDIVYYPDEDLYGVFIDYEDPA